VQITIPEKMLEKLQWDDKTTIDLSIVNASIIIKKRIEWAVLDAQEHIDSIIDDVSENGAVHIIVADNGKKYAFIPYIEEIEKEQK
jgi:antitoxin component of MazEF toxin-antitoxin module